VARILRTVKSTHYFGEIPDQAAPSGALERIESLGLEHLAVSRTEAAR
jgi:hypothetical protein